MSSGAHAPAAPSCPPRRAKVIGCRAVLDEMAALLPPGMSRQVLDIGLHERPDELRRALQAAIDASPGRRPIGDFGTNAS